MRHFFKSFLLILVSFCALSLSTHSYAYSEAEWAMEQQALKAEAKAAESGGFFDNIHQAADQLKKRFNTNILGALKSAGMGFAAALITPALALAGTLSLLYLVYEALMFLGTSDGSFLNRLFDVGVPAILAALLITNYAANINMFEQFLNILRSVGGDPTSAVMDFYGSILKLVGNGLKAALDNVFSIATITNPGATILDAALTCIFALIVLVITLVSMAEVIGLLLLGPFLYAVGLAFGPILLAGIVTPWTREYAGRWVQFIVASAVLSGVLSVVVSIAIKIFDSLGFSEVVSGDPVALTMASVAVILLAVNNLISQAPSIASALVPGSIGARTGGGAGYTKAATNAAKKAPAKAASLGKAVVSKGLGYRAAAKASIAKPIP